MQNKQKVLIVDDNPNNIRLAADSLKTLHISIVFATSGYKALEIIKTQSIDLILMDINMPQMDGFETMSKIDTNISVIFLTAMDDKESILKAFGHGGVDYITKPFYPEELIARVTTHLDLTKLTKNLSSQVTEKTKELEKSMFINQTTGAYNAAKLYLDLSNDTITTAAMFHIKKIQQYEIAFGLHNVEKLLYNFVQWLITDNNYNITTYHITHSDFICLFDTQDIDIITAYCLEIQKELEYLTFTIIDETPIHLHTIITIATGTKKQLIQNLRIAQIEAENTNKKFYIYGQEGMDVIKQQTQNLYWIDKLQQSIHDDTLIPFFQPIVETNTGKIVKYECLARIKDGDKIISPFFFIDAAKQLGVITQVTKIMIEKSCKMFQNSQKELSINITKDDLEEGYLSHYLEKTLQKYNLKKGQITLEVLEEISVFGGDTIVEQLLALKEQGYKIALDDFGSENASFSRMLDLKIDILKIDGMFIKNIATHKNSKLIVQGITHMAKLFNFDIIAEYVHNEEVRSVIEDLGIQYSQGYHFSPPVEIPQDLDKIFV